MIEKADGLCSRLKYPCPKPKPVTEDLSINTRDEWEIPRETLSFGKRLGAGQFGEVWLGKYMNSTIVAIKTLQVGAMSSAAFLAEAQIMKKCRHDKLVRLYAVCTKEEPIYIVTELMSNGALLNYLRDGSKNLDLQTLIDMAAQIASGMSYLEERKFIHRDLAARNILVGENNEVKVADFGLAKIIDEESNPTNDAEVPIKWTAPEAALYRKFTTKSDVWSYGILFVELMTKGEIPYPGMGNGEVLEKIKGGYRMPKPTDCPEAAFEMVLKCWDEDPENRPSFENVFNFFENYYISEEPYYNRVVI
ncbi:hypothetical protein LOTGIDRAFT_130675 [Lottia gigantea]|uniref:non-specific protein-tyrosine kinase n=1 Tax=Lottia gigantea TaxID=225164 RepID=V4B8V7_LOTGI|nr:hypothetical protein LOTGIDRAFT_130675 [Lottia gigantea]ESO85259.1 hypothetical protein LOTGIDRAFT_130675 [Lottia gigantea]